MDIEWILSSFMPTNRAVDHDHNCGPVFDFDPGLALDSDFGLYLDPFLGESVTNIHSSSLIFTSIILLGRLVESRTTRFEDVFACDLAHTPGVSGRVAFYFFRVFGRRTARKQCDRGESTPAFPPFDVDKNILIPRAGR
ncbi:hypothetical protein EVAR_6088_1 [Eumeta japonica]|uniref:Uncharacterized protein n=1 Tax=Eumeta variegata TaxID=151549 RepID=A0A4C1TF34_EUMVA|nr:hypothetical protein EVAR_6088_1 [Eumeta japonica]